MGLTVLVCVAAALRLTGVAVFDSKHAVEGHITRSGVPATIIAPVSFMENLWNPWNRPALAAGMLPSPVPIGRTVQQICLADVYAFAAMAIGNQQMLAQRIAIAADDPTAAQSAADRS